MKSALTKSEASTLKQCEATVERGLSTFVEVGNALLKIRGERLYRAEFKTFEIYCKTRWQMSRIHAHRLIDAAETVGNLLPVGNIPASERATRPLSKLLPAKQREVWSAAIASSKTGKPTGKEVESAVRKIVPISRPVDEGDSDETCWRRGLLCRADEAKASAAFEDWSGFEVSLNLIHVAAQAAKAWSKTAEYLERLYNEQKQRKTA